MSNQISSSAAFVLVALTVLGGFGSSWPDALAAPANPGLWNAGARQFFLGGAGVWVDVDPGNPIHQALDPGITPFRVPDVHGSYPEWFTYTICDDQHADSIIEAIDVLGDIGVPYSGVFADAAACSYSANVGGETIDVTFPVVGANNERVARGQNHSLLAVPGQTGWRFTNFMRSVRYRNPGATAFQYDYIPGVSLPLALGKDGPAGITQNHYGWKIYFPAWSTQLLSFPPAETVIYGGATGVVTAYTPEVALHELIHTLGFQHVLVNESNHSMDTAFGESVSTMMAPSPCPALEANYGFTGATWKDQTLNHPDLSEASSELFLHSKDHASIAAAYNNISDGEPIIVPWHPRMGYLAGSSCAAKDPLPTELNGAATVPLRGCPQGHVPHGFADPQYNSMSGSQFIVEDADELGKIMPLISHYSSSGTHIEPSDLSIFALDASGGMVAESFQDPLKWAVEGALEDHKLAGLEIDPLNIVTFPYPLINFWYYDSLEPPCTGCDRSVDAHQLAIGFAGEPSSAVKIAAYMERPRECGTYLYFPPTGGPPFEVLDEATYPCCTEDTSPPAEE